MIRPGIILWRLMWNNRETIIGRLLFPPCCYLCSALLPRDAEAHLRYICRQCLSDLPFNPSLTRKIPALTGELRQDSVSFWHQKQDLDLYTVFFYEGVIRQLVLGLKFGGHAEYARLLGSVMASALADKMSEAGHRPNAIVPVPLSNSRRLRRGYNQAELLAKYVGVRLRLDVLPLVVRIRDTARQSELNSLAERRGNVRGAFALATDVVSGALRGREFILLDDVLSSGHTMLACAEVLQRAGATVICLVAASGSSRRYLTERYQG